MAGEFDQFKFLDAEERALLEESAANDYTVDQIASRMEAPNEGEQPMRQAPIGPHKVRDGYNVNEPHSDFPKSGQSNERKLVNAAVDYDDTVKVLDVALAAAEEAFAVAFARADERAAIRRRIDGTANPKAQAEARNRVTRIG